MADEMKTAMRDRAALSVLRNWRIQKRLPRLTAYARTLAQAAQEHADRPAYGSIDLRG